MNQSYTQTNVRLPKTLLKELRMRALEQGKSLAQLMRELCELYVNGNASVARPARRALRQTALDHIVNLAKRERWTGPRDLSSRLDDYLYGDE